MSDWIMDHVIGWLLFLVMGALFVGMLLAGFDTLQDRRAYRAQVNCLSQRMRPARQILGTTVVCLPDNSRQDTTTVNLNESKQ